MTSPADETLGRIGGRERPPQAVGQIEPEHRERFVETFTDALGRTGMMRLESTREVGEKATSGSDVDTAIGPPLKFNSERGNSSRLVANSAIGAPVKDDKNLE